MVEKEMLRFWTKAIKFEMPSIGTLPKDEWFWKYHLNIRGCLNHIWDIKEDTTLCSANVICFNEELQTKYITIASLPKITLPSSVIELQALRRVES